MADNPLGAPSALSKMGFLLLWTPGLTASHSLMDTKERQSLLITGTELTADAASADVAFDQLTRLSCYRIPDNQEDLLARRGGQDRRADKILCGAQHECLVVFKGCRRVIPGGFRS